MTIEQQLAAAHEAMRSMEAQLVALYEEREHAPDVGALEAMVESLDAQVCALVEEKLALEAQLAELAPAGAA